MNIRQDKLGFRPFPTVYLDGALRGYHSVHRGLGKRVELLVVPPHEVWLEQEPAVAIVLELPYHSAPHKFASKVPQTSEAARKLLHL